MLRTLWDWQLDVFGNYLFIWLPLGAAVLLWSWWGKRREGRGR